MDRLREVMTSPGFSKLPRWEQVKAMQDAGADDQLVSEWVQVNAKGPTMAPLQEGAKAPEGWESTKGEHVPGYQNVEPNAAGEVLPRLVEFTALGLLPEAAAAGGAGLRGLSLGTKAVRVGKAATKAAAIGTAGIAADQAMQEAGVPPTLSKVIVAGAGLGTKPGRAAIKAGYEALAASAVPAAGRAAAGPAAAEVAAALEAGGPKAVRELMARYGVKTSVAPTAAEFAASNAGDATAVTNPAQEIADQVVRWKTQNKWSGAQIASALKNVYGISPKDSKKLIQMVEAETAAASSLQPERVRIGSQNVGRQLGMTKEEVRMQAGPVLDEALGEASPVLPKEALKSIIDKMKSMPMAEREAYVAKATSGKTKWQVENIRRTLEHLGLLIPATAAAGVAVDSEG